jgi:hypothetical protein
MVSERCGIFLSYQFSAISRQGFFSEHSTENRCKKEIHNEKVNKDELLVNRFSVSRNNNRYRRMG